MSHGYLPQMLEYLTGAYAREDIRNAKHSLPLQTNIGKLFGTLAWGLEIIHDNADRMKLWDNIDNAQGAVLDRYGANFGVLRGGANDAFYRLLIKIKMIALLSGGDIDTIINAAANLFNVQPENIELRELFPAKLYIYVDEDLLDAERREAAPLIAELMKRISAAGVGTKVFLRTYRKARAEVFYAIPAFICSEIDAQLRSYPFRNAKAAFYAACVVWEETTITANMKAR